MTSSKVAALVAAGALVLAAGCSGGAGPDTTATQPPPYAHHGPDTVGVATLDLGSAGPVFGERYATVYYPAVNGPAARYPQFSYSEASTLPTALQGILPAKYNTTTTVDAYVGPPASTKGPFPIVLFSHGYGGERLYYSNLLTGIASWGYVVVSADYLERGLAAQALNVTTSPTAAQDSAVMQSSLTAVEAASADPSSPLHGVADPKQVAAVGHSAGGGTAFDALDSPAVATAVGWAPEPPTGTPSSKPVMLIGAEGDTVITRRTSRRPTTSSRGRRHWSRSPARDTTPTPISAPASGPAAG